MIVQKKNKEEVGTKLNDLPMGSSFYEPGEEGCLLIKLGVYERWDEDIECLYLASHYEYADTVFINKDRYVIPVRIEKIEYNEIK